MRTFEKWFRWPRTALIANAIFVRGRRIRRPETAFESNAKAWDRDWPLKALKSPLYSDFHVATILGKWLFENLCQALPACASNEEAWDRDWSGPHGADWLGLPSPHDLSPPPQWLALTYPLAPWPESSCLTQILKSQGTWKEKISELKKKLAYCENRLVWHTFSKVRQTKGKKVNKWKKFSML